MVGELIWFVRRTSALVERFPHRWKTAIRCWARFWVSYLRYCRLATDARKPDPNFLYPCIYDSDRVAPIEPIYFYQDSWAFERIVHSRPEKHVDVGSHHKFVAFLSKLMDVTMVDIRPWSVALTSVRFKQGSILELPFEDGTVQSLSCLCVVEHIGLGRYGDPLDFHGTERAMAELKRVLAPGGNLYISLPLDDQTRTYFNAHRAFAEPYFESLIEPLQIVERCYIVGDSFQREPGSGFRTGCYHLQKLPQQDVSVTAIPRTLMRSS